VIEGEFNNLNNSTTTWSESSQEHFWSLLTNQFNLSRNKEVMQIIVSIRDFLNNRCKDAHFDTNQYYGLVRGFRRFFSDALKIKDDVCKKFFAFFNFP